MRSFVLLLPAFVVFLFGCTSENGVGSDFPLEEKTSAGVVTVSLLPESYANGVLYVGYVLDTHSVELSAMNLQEQVTLYMGGKEVKPSNSPSLSGHHASGALEFGVGSFVLPLRIVVRDVPDSPVREFVWGAG